MQISNIRIRNFRTIKNEITFTARSGMTIVGPNNAGKSNILRAIGVFFSGVEANKYDISTDLSHGVHNERTSITVSFEANEPELDADFVRLHEELRSLHPEPPPKTSAINLSVYFTEKNKAVYSFFPNIKRPSGAPNAQYSRVQSDLIEKIFGTFKVIYIPSAKSYAEIFSDVVSPEIVKSTREIISKVVPEVNDALKTITDIMNSTLDDCGMLGISTRISTGQRAHADFMSGVELQISDQIVTEFSRKGTGVQSAAIFSALVWIDQVRRSEGLRPIWLIEEPESYLHPELTGVVNRLLRKLGSRSAVVISTHSLAFVPTDVENVAGCEIESGRTVLKSFDTYYRATERIRGSLGVKFSDYFSLSEFNVGVEGHSDKSIFEAIYFILLTSGFVEVGRYPKLDNAKYLTFGGVKDLTAFVKTTYPMVSKERAFVSVLDGDDAGVRSRQELQQFFGNKQVRFESGMDFLSVRSGFAIEGLFPDLWVTNLQERSPQYFRSYSVDAQGGLEPFAIYDNHKSSAQNYLMERARSEDPSVWASRFINVFDALELALDRQSKALNPS
ncbi:cytochrome c biogenesis protein CcmA [Devosia sp. LC5]|uniref:ATP-dependent nuclease n=1 Tax=Devosia sp. LC5 TaxID=1502724 RepID=UPI0004E3E5B9|nr:AAA family ATPase [Devosia sp. LC5]KFC63763.1 cytochrome c biogenesis protein CcmA [Devosia sp. LC5]